MASRSRRNRADAELVATFDAVVAIEGEKDCRGARAGALCDAGVERGVLILDALALVEYAR